MKFKFIFTTIFLLLFSIISNAQNVSQTPNSNQPPTQESIELLTVEVKNISKSLDTFNERLNTFLESLNKYKGIQISERQQKLLFGYEVLNQTEQLAATLRKSLIETGEKEATLKRKIAQIDSELRPENVDRGIQLKGTTQAEENRESRRRVLLEERNALQNVLSEAIQSRIQIAENLRQTELFADSFRRSLFNQIRSEMTDF